MRPFNQLFLSEKAPESKLIGHCSDLNLKHVCDINDNYGPDSIFYRYNEGKTISWLKLKVTNLMKQLDCMSEALDENNAHSGVAKSFVVAGSSDRNNMTEAAVNKKNKIILVDLKLVNLLQVYPTHLYRKIFQISSYMI